MTILTFLAIFIVFHKEIALLLSSPHTSIMNLNSHLGLTVYLQQCLYACIKPTNHLTDLIYMCIGNKKL